MTTGLPCTASDGHAKDRPPGRVRQTELIKSHTVRKDPTRHTEGKDDYYGVYRDSRASEEE